MSFLALSPAQIAFNEVFAARKQIRDEAVALRREADQGRVIFVPLMRLHNSLVRFEGQWALASGVPGIADVAADNTGQSKATIVQDYQEVQQAGTQIILWVRANLGEVYELVQGELRPKAYDISGMSTALDNLIAALGD